MGVYAERSAARVVRSNGMGVYTERSVVGVQVDVTGEGCTLRGLRPE